MRSLKTYLRLTPLQVQLESKPGFELRFQQGFDWLKTEFELHFMKNEVLITPYFMFIECML